MARKGGDISVSEAFELFLDTISNAFAGIVFIFLMTCVNLGVAGDATPVYQEPADRAAAIEAGSTLANLEADIKRLRESIDGLQKLRREQGARFSKTNFEKYADLKEEIARFEKSIAADDTTSEEQKSDSLQSQLQERNEVNSELKNQLDDAKARKLEKKPDDISVRKLRVPRARLVPKTSVALLLAKGRLYFVSTWTEAGEQGAIDENEVDFEKSGLVGTLAPKSGRGFRIDSSPRFETWWRKNTKRFKKDRHAYQVFVWPDSFNEADILRDRFMRAGFGYSMVPKKEGEKVSVVSGGGGGATEQ